MHDFDPNQKRGRSFFAHINISHRSLSKPYFVIGTKACSVRLNASHKPICSHTVPGDENGHGQAPKKPHWRSGIHRGADRARNFSFPRVFRPCGGLRRLFGMGGQNDAVPLAPNIIYNRGEHLLLFFKLKLRLSGNIIRGKYIHSLDT